MLCCSLRKISVIFCGLQLNLFYSINEIDQLQNEKTQLFTWKVVASLPQLELYLKMADQ